MLFVLFFIEFENQQFVKQIETERQTIDGKNIVNKNYKNIFLLIVIQL